MINTALEKITQNSCDMCGCADVRKSVKENQHVSGEWNESLLFKCGREFEYCPNFPNQGVIATHICERSRDFEEIKQKQEKFKTSLEKLIDKSDIDEAFRSRVKYAFQYL